MVFAHYDALLKAGWTLPDIDAMDFMGYLDVLCWRAMQEEGTQPGTIDEIPFLQPTAGVKDV